MFIGWALGQNPTGSEGDREVLASPQQAIQFSIARQLELEAGLSFNESV
ncbi:hypothetical protein ACVOMS_31680 [Bradyrhizobium guangxiense]